MSARVEWKGLAELLAALRGLPEELAEEGGEIVLDHANRAASRIKAAYPVRTGNLRNGVEVETRGSAFRVGAVVRNNAPHAYMFEYGTEARHTAIGANRGRMPPGHVFVPVVVVERAGMYDQLKRLLERKGLKVSGSER